MPATSPQDPGRPVARLDGSGGPEAIGVELTEVGMKLLTHHQCGDQLPRAGASLKP
jgi:hypothetical protein